MSGPNPNVVYYRDLTSGCLLSEKQDLPNLKWSSLANSCGSTASKFLYVPTTAPFGRLQTYDNKFDTTKCITNRQNYVEGLVNRDTCIQTDNSGDQEFTVDSLQRKNSSNTYSSNFPESLRVGRFEKDGIDVRLRGKRYRLSRFRITIQVQAMP